MAAQVVILGVLLLTVAVTAGVKPDGCPRIHRSTT